MSVMWVLTDITKSTYYRELPLYIYVSPCRKAGILTVLDLDTTPDVSSHQ